MMRLSVVMLWVLSTVALSVSARAEWMHQVLEDPFVGDQQMALAIQGSAYSVGFRCTSESDLAIIFLTPERAESENARIINMMAAKMLVIIDDAPKVELKAKIEVVADGNQLRIVADDPEVTSVFERAKTAKRRFAVAVEVMGQIGHRETFNVRGSTRALQALAKGCRIEPSSAADASRE